jgi:hypothetical protein
MICPPGKPAAGRRGVRTHRSTLVVSRLPDRPEETVLHDNVSDPYQLRNIAAERADVVKSLVERELIPWLRKTGDPWLGS